MTNEISNDELYQFEEKGNRKARNRTLLILGAGAALGVGAVAATAMGFAGPNQEVSILENHEGFGPVFGEDHEEREGHERDGDHKPRFGEHDHEDREGHEPDFSDGVTE